MSAVIRGLHVILDGRKALHLWHEIEKSGARRSIMQNAHAASALGDIFELAQAYREESSAPGTQRTELPEPDGTSDYVTTAWAARELAITPRGVIAKLRRGDLPGTKDESGRWLIPRNAVRK